jgi:hypothetical protein
VTGCVGLFGIFAYMVDLRTISLVRLEWNSDNGFVFEVAQIETNRFDVSLFGVNADPRFLIINLLGFNITVFDHTGTNKQIIDGHKDNP